MADFADDGLSLHEFDLEYGRQGETQGDPERKLLLAVLVQAIVDLGRAQSVKIGKRNRACRLSEETKEDADLYFRDIMDERLTSLNGIAEQLGMSADAIRRAILGRKFKPLRSCPSCRAPRPPKRSG